MNTKLALFGTLALALSACYPVATTATIEARPGISRVETRSVNFISSFTPTRGEGATYVQGEAVSFRISTRTAGYVTLVGLDSDGVSYVFDRNIYVNPGTTILSGPAGRQYELVCPCGIQRVQAIFTTTDQRGQASFSLGGRYSSETGWRSQLNIYVDRFPQTSRDVVETFFFIRR